MEDDATQRGYRLFRAATMLSSGERDAFLATHEAADPEAVAVARQALILLSQETEIPEDGAIVRDPRLSERIGTTVGGWKLEKFLGAGGYGRVYLASKTTEGGRQDAAVKFLDFRPTEARRFRLERQLLASLNHPGIPRFIDAGTEDGVPYLVMEYVSGSPINTYCANNRLTLSERLRLFISLCHVLEYAHRHVLHRDLKPGNILVTPGGQVRVLDLGLATEIDPAERGEALTRPGAPVFTKAYASPEQIRQEHLSWATDAYGLGVILYELVTGRLPFSDFALSGPDWREVICERQPLPPSQAFQIGEPVAEGGPAFTPPETASLGEAPSKLKRMLAGDLDAIILKSLAKIPRFRYRRVQDLRVDLERFLSGLSVTARKSTLLERVPKWAVKNPGTAALFAASGLLLFTAGNISAIRFIEYNARYVDEENAVRRLEFLLHSGVPEIERSLPSGAAREVREAAVRIHSNLLDLSALLPEKALLRLDQSLMESGLDCGRQWMQLGDPSAGLRAISGAMERAAIRYQADPHEPLWRRQYAALLRQRVEMRIMLHEDPDASGDVRRLIALGKQER